MKKIKADKRYTLSVIILLSLMFCCTHKDFKSNQISSRLKASPDASADSGGDADVNNEELRDKIRELIDFDDADIVLVPDCLDRKVFDVAPEFDPEKFLNALSRATGEKDCKTIEHNSERWVGQTSRFDIEIDLDEFFIRMESRKEEPWDNENKHFDDSYYLSKGSIIMNALDIFDDEEDIEIRGTVAFDDDGTKHEIDKVYESYRRICNLGVSSNRMLILFNVDGTLRGMIGTWTRLNYSKSLLYSTLTENEFIERAIDETIRYLYVDPDEVESIYLSTYYDSKTTQDSTNIIVLKGVVGLSYKRGYGPEGFYFDIDSAIYESDYNPDEAAENDSGITNDEDIQEEEEKQTASGCNIQALPILDNPALYSIMYFFLIF